MVRSLFSHRQDGHGHSARGGLLARIIAVLLKVPSSDGGDDRKAPGPDAPEHDEGGARDARRVRRSTPELEIGVGELRRTTSATAVATSRPAEARTPLGGELLDIVEKALDR